MCHIQLRNLGYTILVKKASIFIVCLSLLLTTFIIFNQHNTFAIELIKVKPHQIIEPTVSIYPKTILPGDPVFIIVNSTSSVKEIIFDNKDAHPFNYKGKSSAFVGIDFNEKVIKHIVKVIFSNGSIITKQITLKPRKKMEKPLGIPSKLGGNTPKAEKNLLDNLAKENFILNNITSTTTRLWVEAFTQPLDNPKVTDEYGYNRKTVNSIIVHKGTDFHAPVGTRVLAMNDGVVKIARDFIIYGKTVVIDHGLGLLTLYMHLSKINVKERDSIKAGQVLGLSGQTGYADQPHLHVSIKINTKSIDPMTFLGFFK